MGITSYAQNFEDVMLWRALGHIPNGLYIDVGAQHPIVDSVSKAFYEHGWRGIHVEPTTTYANLLRTDRPDEVIIQAALSNHTGTVQFYEIAETGLSTADRTIAANHQAQGFAINETVVPCMTLADVFNLTAGKDIHWLKIDVEGFEKQVLEGWGNASARPWIIAVESTLPLTTIETHENWEALLLERGYQASYFDGLNRYYLSDEHLELKAEFHAGPNVFDDFFLYGKANAPFCNLLNQQHKDNVEKIESNHRQDRLAVQEQLDQANSELLNQKAQFHQEKKEHEQCLQVLEQNIAQLKSDLNRQGQDYQERERRILDKCHGKETVLGQQSTVDKQQIHNLLRILNQQTNAFTQQLLRQQEENNQALTDQAKFHTQREIEIAKKLEESNTKQQKILHESTQREINHSEQIHKIQQEKEIATEKLQLQIRQIQNSLLNLEREHYQRLLNENEKYNQRISEQKTIYHEREKHLLEKISTFQSTFQQNLDEKTIIEMELRHQISKDRESIILLKASLSSIETSIWWRISGPLRKFLNGHTTNTTLNKLLPNNTISRQKHYTGTHQENIHDAHSLILENEKAMSSSSKLRKIENILTLNSKEFIEGAYSIILGRECDKNGLNHYIKFLKNGTEKSKIIADILSSKEYQNKTTKSADLDELLKCHTQKKIPLLGITLWSPLRNSASLVSYINKTEDSLKNSKSSDQSTQNTNKEILLSYALQQNGVDFITSAYQIILCRKPDTEGLNYYKGKLAEGCSKSSIISQLALSKEFKIKKKSIPGLKKITIKTSLSNIPIIGNIFKIFFIEERNGSHKKFRAIQNQLHFLENKIEDNFVELKYLIENIENKENDERKHITTEPLLVDNEIIDISKDTIGHDATENSANARKKSMSNRTKKIYSDIRTKY